MDTILYATGWTLMAVLQALPLRWVARIGRAGGALAYVLDARHRKVAVKNMSLCFPEKPAAEITALAKENFRRLGENYASAVKTSSMSAEAIRPHLSFAGCDKVARFRQDGTPQSCVVAVGHFGNFELYVRFGDYITGFKAASTYRALRQPSLNRLMQSMRSRSGCQFFERRTGAAALKAAMSDSGLLLGLFTDQHAGDTGIKLPFFGRDCSTSAAPAVFALRYGCPLHTAICYRVGLAKWHVEVGDEIPTLVDGEPRSSADIMRDVNAAYEAGIRRDPANWFWVHNRWKPGKWRERPSTRAASSETDTVAEG